MCYLVDAITIDKMLGEVGHQVIPALHALGRRDILLVPERMQRIGIEG